MKFSLLFDAENWCKCGLFIACHFFKQDYAENITEIAFKTSKFDIIKFEVEDYFANKKFKFNSTFKTKLGQLICLYTTYLKFPQRIHKNALNIHSTLIFPHFSDPTTAIIKWIRIFVYNFIMTWPPWTVSSFLTARLLPRLD